MRFLSFFSVAIPGVLMACSTGSQPDESLTTADTEARNGINQLRIPFANPVLLDSSAYVLYPLPLNETITKESDGYGSSRYNSENTYWNIVFYNPRTNDMRLLDEHRKMVIRSYQVADADPSAANSSSRISRTSSVVDNLIFYSVITEGFNRDGKLTTDDPSYLFASDKAGRNFRQLSPDSLDVTNWVIQKSTGKLFIQTNRDANRDRKFGSEDEIIPYVYNPAAKQPAARVFDLNSIKNFQTTFQNNWGKKVK